MYKVVIIEDEEMIRKGLVYSIPWTDIGCTVVGQGRNGLEGIEQIQLHQPDIVIADINMPLLSGTDMLRQTHADYGYSAIILSGYSSFEYAQDAMACGAIRYLLKPLKREDLFDAIEEAKEQCDIRRTWFAHRQSQEQWRSFHIELQPPSGVVTDRVVQSMLDYAQANYQEKVTLQSVSEALNYSIAFLNKSFKKQMGTTFIEYLNRLRIQKAMDMLKEGNTPLQDISWKCGIGDYKYFNIVFKKYIGCSPKEYAAKVNCWLE